MPLIYETIFVLRFFTLVLTSRDFMKELSRKDLNVFHYRITGVRTLTENER